MMVGEAKMSYIQANKKHSISVSKDILLYSYELHKDRGVLELLERDMFRKNSGENSLTELLVSNKPHHKVLYRVAETNTSNAQLILTCCSHK